MTTQSTYVFFTEELSMKSFLEALLPRLGLPDSVKCLVLSSAGKTDLKTGLEKRLKAWSEPVEHFFVLMDNDSKPSCKDTKQELQTSCQDSGKSNVTVIIVCQELEAWYFGDVAALKEKCRKKHHGKRFALPQRHTVYDKLTKPYDNHIKHYIDNISKTQLAAEMGRCIRLTDNTSGSFNHLLKKVQEKISKPDAIVPTKNHGSY
jgi:hypothetical protein